MGQLIDFRSSCERRMLHHQKALQTLLDDKGRTIPLARVATIRNSHKELAVRVAHYDRTMYGSKAKASDYHLPAEHVMTNISTPVSCPMEDQP